MLLKCNLHLVVLCLLVGCYKLTAKEALYIIPSLSSSCPQQHCFTLEQLLSNAWRNFSSNTILYFLPGTHCLQSEYVIGNISELYLQSVSDFPLETARISCGSTTRILIENVHFVHVSHLHFIGCCENKIESVNQLIINNSTFHGLQGRNGTALELIHTNAKIINSSFLFNQYGGYRGPLGLLEFLIKRKQIPPQSVYARIGGALIVNSSNVSATDSRFEGNIAQIGGAIFGEGNSNISLTNCILINNHALSSSNLKGAGGVLLAFELTHITITESIFDNNSAQLHGGVIFMTKVCNLIILQCQINNNKASEGGVVSAKFQSNVTVLDSDFNKNTAYESGGVIRTYDGATLHITNSSFRECIAKYGGVLTHKKHTLAIVSRCSFYHNFATEEGGVFLSLINSHIALLSCNFIDNRAIVGGVGNVASHLGGAAYAIEECSVYIERCQFNNSKASEGGVVSAKFQSNVTVLDSDFNNNTAYESGGVIRIYDGATLHITNSSFRECIAKYGGVLTHKKNTLVIVSNCSFYSNFATKEGGVFYSLNNSHIALIGCNFINNRAVLGGVGTAKLQCNVTIRDSSAFNNVASHQGGVALEKYNASGGVVKIVHSSKLIMKDCEMYNNTAQYGGAVFASTHSSMYINNTQFTYNLATVGGVFELVDQANATITNCNFSENSGTNGGGAITLVSGTLTLTHNIFKQNDGWYGGAIRTNYAIATIVDSTFTGNKGFAGGTLFCYNSHNITLVNTLISESIASSGSVYVVGTVFHFQQNVTITKNVGTVQVLMGTTLHLLGFTTFENNIMSNLTIKTNAKLNEGGALTVDRSNVHIHGPTYFYNNTAEKGAAIHVTNSNVNIEGTVIIANNTARYNGGGLYLYQSDITCSFLKLIGNHALNSGGGIYAASSTIDILSLFDTQTSLMLIDNSAQVGGGLYMKANAKLHILKVEHKLSEQIVSSPIVFYHNLADYGGAIAVEDSTNLGTYDSNPHSFQTSSLNQEYVNYTECFLQVDDLHNKVTWTEFDINYDSDSINFIHNYARYAGSTLFGGLLDRCIAISFVDAFFNIPVETIIYNGISYLKHISNIVEDKVSSHPVRVCFCNNNLPDCSYELPMKQLKKGENFTLALVAVDQVNHTIGNTTIHAYLMFAESGFGEGQLIQKTGESCTDLTYSMTTIHDHERIVIYAEGPCRDSSISKKWIDIEFIPCSCPIGFQQKDTENTNCVCICDSALLPYVSSCNAQDETVTKSNNAWINYANQTCTLNSSGYLIHDHCPFDYCLSPNSDHEIKVNLNEKNGADAQCAHNRIGTLCGICKPGFSLSLGSSHCIPCSHWKMNLPVILSTAIISGVILVAMLLVLNLTVAVGTLNGIIFYANIVASNFSTFFPFSSPNFVTFFIAWLNLDIGIDTCFFKGMDAYWKLWIDILFPAYLIILVAMIVFICEKSTRFVRLIGRKNPVATLATLILLSYTKLLRTIISSFSFAVLKYPDNSVQLVWLPDGTVKYLSGKHITLFIMALVIVIVGVAYTLLLFLWQWILRNQHKILLKWANNQKLNHFLDPYHAPYVCAYRYWTGLLLLIRAALYIIAAVNVSNDPGINLLAIGFAVVSILLLKGSLKRNTIYNKWPLDLIEMVWCINLTFFCLMSFYLLNDKAKQRVVAYISGCITLALFIIILFYHIIFELIFKLLKRSRNQPVYQEVVTQIDIEENLDDQTALVEPTSSTVEAPPPGELPLSVLIKAEAQSE